MDYGTRLLCQLQGGARGCSQDSSKQVLLEIDDPYFPPRGRVDKDEQTYNYGFSVPSHVVNVAAQVAALKGVSLVEVVEANMKNLL